MKRLLTLFLVVLLLLGCCPLLQANALAEGTGLADTISSTAAGSVVVLQQDCAEEIAVDKNLTIDLNGYTLYGTITVAQGCVLTVKDCKTDDYTIDDADAYGKIKSVSGTVMAADGYLMISEVDGISFHKVDMKLTTITLRPENVGIYYTGEFRGDELVAANVDTFGIALRLKQMPDSAYMSESSACSRYYDFQAGGDGNTAGGTLLKNVMRKGRPAAENKSNSQTKIYGAPYIRTCDGQYHFDTGKAYSLMQVMQETDKQWNKLNQTQKNAVKKMYNSFESIIGTWYLPNINDTDIDIPI